MRAHLWVDSAGLHLDTNLIANVRDTFLKRRGNYRQMVKLD